MPLLADYCLDAALAKVAEATHIYICNAEPTTYTQASATFALGVKAAPTFAAAADGTPDGRKIVLNAITAGTTNTTGTGSHWALVDQANSRLLATKALAASQVLTAGNPWSLAAVDVCTVRDAT
jgi:hypothetical protein